MAKQGGMGDNFYVDGYNLSGDVQSLGRVGGGPTMGDVTSIDKAAFERLGLLRDGTMEFTSFFNDEAVTAPLGAVTVLKALPTTDRIASYFRGTAVGSPAASGVSKQVNFDPQRGQDGMISMTTALQANGYGIEWGDQLTAGKRTDTGATNGASIDLGAVSTLFGATAYLHVFAVTGTSVTVTVQDSADNSAFTAVTGLAFSAVTGGSLSVQRLSTTTTATIRRYVRVATTGTFSNAQFAVNFVRYVVAQS